MKRNSFIRMKSKDHTSAEAGREREGARGGIFVARLRGQRWRRCTGERRTLWGFMLRDAEPLLAKWAFFSLESHPASSSVSTAASWTSSATLRSPQQRGKRLKPRGVHTRAGFRREPAAPGAVLRAGLRSSSWIKEDVKWWYIPISASLSFIVTKFFTPGTHQLPLLPATRFCWLILSVSFYHPLLTSPSPLVDSFQSLILFLHFGSKSVIEKVGKAKFLHRVWVRSCINKGQKCYIEKESCFWNQSWLRAPAKQI